MDIVQVLSVMVKKGASDVYLTVGSPPVYRIDGTMQPMGDHFFTPVDLETLARGIMNEKQWDEFTRNLEMDLVLMLSVPDLSRFRVNVLRQRGSVAMVVRKIKYELKTLDELGLPTILKELAIVKRGLVFVVGATGTGKSTMLAAMMDYRNAYGPGHILTIEDPIEFVHKHKKCLVTQRELGFDTHSFGDALKRAVHQAPDVILIGEIRDSVSMEAAITFADTGHLCLAAMHSTNAHQSFERILEFFPQARHAQILMRLSLNLRAIISQRLIRSLDGGRVPALEILVNTPRIKDLIRSSELERLREALDQGTDEGCQTFEQSLLALYKAGRIGVEEALANADRVHDLRLKMKQQGLKGDEAIEMPVRAEDRDKNFKGFRIEQADSLRVVKF